jgi:hypothetical protein
MLVQVDPPFIGQKFGLGGKDLETIVRRFGLRAIRSFPSLSGHARCIAFES